MYVFVSECKNPHMSSAVHKKEDIRSLETGDTGKCAMFGMEAASWVINE